MNNLMTIQSVRGYMKNDTAYLNLEDVARGLGFTQEKNGTQYVRWETVYKYLEEFGYKYPLDFSQLVGKADFIPENIFYRLAMKAKNETAEKFQALVADEILPSIRKHGAYMTPDTLEQMITSPEFGIRLLSEIKAEREKRQQAEALVEAQKPKVVFADAVEVSKSSILIGDLAKIIKQNGYDTGQKRLFEFLRQNGYLMKGGSSKNMPTQRAMDAGLFEVKESTINNPDGSVRITKTTKVTGKGQVYFVNLFLAQKAV